MPCGKASAGRKGVVSARRVKMATEDQVRICEEQEHVEGLTGRTKSHEASFYQDTYGLLRRSSLHVNR